MPYGIIKIDTVTFTNDGVDKSVSISGLVQNPTFSGNVTVTGTLSGVTVTGTTASFTSGNFTNISGGTHTITSGVFAAGSAANPSISFTSDPNTGIYSPGADQVAISTNGTGRLFVDASGNVGIAGTPFNPLDVFGSATLGIRYKSSGSYAGIVADNTSSTGGGYFGAYQNGSQKAIFGVTGAFIGDTSADAGLFAETGQAIRFFTNGSVTEKARITSDGKLGLGTSSPSNTFHVNGSGGGSFTSGYTNALARINATTNTAGQGAALALTAIATKETAWIISAEHTSGNNGDLAFYGYPGGASYSEFMRLTSTGRLGVGTTSVNTTLEVLNSSTPIIRVGDGTRHMELRGGSTTQNAAIGTNYAGGFDIIQNGSAAVTIDASKRVLVGTSSGSALLQVNGTFRAGDQATSGMSGNNATILSATPPSGALAAEIHCFGKDYSTSGANNHVGLLVAYWSADTNTINTTTNIDNSTGTNQGFEVIWSSPNLVVRNKTGMTANQSARAWIRWLA